MSSTGSAPTSRTTAAASNMDTPRVTASSVMATLSPGSSAPAMRPPPPWSLTSLRTLNALSWRPWVAAMAAMANAMASAPMVSPPTAVTSSGSAASAASATRSMPSGRHVVCLASMNHVVGLPDFKTKSPCFTACVRRWSISASLLMGVDPTEVWVTHFVAMTRVVAIANQKGGVAKTTSTHALGVAMAERGKRVLLVDLDPQASLTWACGVDPDALQVSIHDVLLKRARAADAIVELPAPKPSGSKPGVLHLLPSTIDLAGAELNLLTKTGREYVLRKALSKVAERYDRVLIDCPPSLGILTINGLTAADEVVIPLQCESLSQRGVGQLLETIEDVRDYTNEDLEVRGAIATLFDGRTKLSHQVVEQVRREYGIKVLEPFVPKSVKVAEAPARGRSVLTHAPKSRSAEAYRELANQLLGRKGS